MSWRSVRSRVSEPTAPRKYFVVTIVEALTLQKSGNSTPRCSKTLSPVFQLVWTTSRASHVDLVVGVGARRGEDALDRQALAHDLGARLGMLLLPGAFVLGVARACCRAVRGLGHVRVGPLASLVQRFQRLWESRASCLGGFRGGASGSFWGFGACWLMVDRGWSRCGAETYLTLPRRTDTSAGVGPATRR